MNKVKTALMSAKTKKLTIMAAMLASITPTYCDFVGKLDSVSDIVFTLAKWGGGIIGFAGLCMIGKAFMDSTSGQSQPGALGKGLGVLVLGVIMLFGSTVISSL